MKTTGFAWVAGLTLLAGCATTPAGQQAAEGAGADTQAAEAGLICEDQAVTGSNMRRRVCRKASEVEQERDQAQRRIQSAPKANERFGQ